MKSFLMVGKYKPNWRAEDVEDIGAYLLSIVDEVLDEYAPWSASEMESKAIKLTEALIAEPKALQAMQMVGQIESIEGDIYTSPIELRKLLERSVSLVSDDTPWVSFDPWIIEQEDNFRDCLGIEVKGGVDALIQSGEPIDGMFWVSEPNPTTGEKILLILPVV